MEEKRINWSRLSYHKKKPYINRAQQILLETLRQGGGVASLGELPVWTLAQFVKVSLAMLHTLFVHPLTSYSMGIYIATLQAICRESNT